jgi:hypothetical protein
MIIIAEIHRRIYSPNTIIIVETAIEGLTNFVL